MIKKAERKSIPIIMSLAGTSGSGKTYSALLLAAGLAGENGKVGFIDTELGRGSMYADDPDIVQALPGNEYYVDEITEPFAPAKYMQKIKEFISYGVNVLVIDSCSHWWEGFGGCQDIAENNKLRGMPNWAKAKMEHKRLMNMLTQCPMHVILCLRAREKSKPMKNPDTGKTEIVEIGLQPIQEKNFMYEMTLSMLLEDNEPGKPIVTKCPKPLLHLFTGEQNTITKEAGSKLRVWAEGGASIDMKLRNLKRECREAAMSGSANLDKFFKELGQDDKQLIAKLTDKEFQTEVRSLAQDADNLESQNESESSKLFEGE